MIAQEYKIITVHTDRFNNEICLRIEDDEQIGGILNLCWLNEKETDKLICELQKKKEEMKERREKMDELIHTTNFSKLYADFENRYNKYPVQMSRAEAFGRAYSDGLIDRDMYMAAEKYYKKLWCYVGD